MEVSSLLAAEQDQQYQMQVVDQPVRPNVLIERRSPGEVPLVEREEERRRREREIERKKKKREKMSDRHLRNPMPTK